jgi:lipopolysaccharide export system protein LptA
VNAHLAGVLFFALGTLCFAHGQTEVRSDSVAVTDCSDCMLFSFSGHVAAAGDKFELHSERLEVIFPKEDNLLRTGECATSIKELHAFGSVKFTQDCRCGTADEMVVDPARGTVALLGNATVTSPDGTAHGDKLLLSRDSNSIEIESSGRSTISVNSIDGKQPRDKKLEPCDGAENFTDYTPHE